jgi:TfoX/Sxy family transcriptional regulator of competence genes
MAYDEELATRVRAVLADRSGIDERRMFGGLVFLVDGNMACGVTGDELMVRLAEASAADALAEPATRPFDMAGRPMKKLVLVGAEGVAADGDLAAWVQQGVDYAGGLPPKPRG